MAMPGFFLDHSSRPAWAVSRVRKSSDLKSSSGLAGNSTARQTVLQANPRVMAASVRKYLTGGRMAAEKVSQ
jgi:hypothetical protein